MRSALVGAATVAALAAGTLATTGVFGSSHREAPRIMLDPAADNTDLYAFVSPDRPDSVTIDRIRWSCSLIGSLESSSTTATSAASIAPAVRRLA